MSSSGDCACSPRSGVGNHCNSDPGHDPTIPTTPKQTVHDHKVAARCRSDPHPRSNHVDPFDPKYAHVPLDVPLSHVEDYVKRKNSRNDQDHLQSQIMFFKKEFGNLHCGKSRIKTTSTSTSSTNNSNNTTTTRSSSTTTSTQTSMSSSMTSTQNDDHKDDSDRDDEDEDRNHHLSLLNMAPMLTTDDFLVPTFESLHSIRNALARYESHHMYQRWCRAQYRRHQRHEQQRDDNGEAERAERERDRIRARIHDPTRMEYHYYRSIRRRRESNGSTATNERTEITESNANQTVTVNEIESDHKEQEDVDEDTTMSTNQTDNDHHHGEYQYVAPFYNPFLRLQMVDDQNDQKMAETNNVSNTNNTHSTPNGAANGTSNGGSNGRSNGANTSMIRGSRLIRPNDDDSKSIEVLDLAASNSSNSSNYNSSGTSRASRTSMASSSSTSTSTSGGNSYRGILESDPSTARRAAPRFVYDFEIDPWDPNSPLYRRPIRNTNNTNTNVNNDDVNGGFNGHSNGVSNGSNAANASNGVSNPGSNGHDTSTQTTSDLQRRYERQFRRYRYSFRALQHHHMRRRIWQRRMQRLAASQNGVIIETRNNSNGSGGDGLDDYDSHHPFDLDDEFVRDNLYILPMNYDDDAANMDEMGITERDRDRNRNDQESSGNGGNGRSSGANSGSASGSVRGRHFSRLQSLLAFNATMSDDDESNLKIKTKLKTYSSRLDGLADFKAAASLIPLKLTAKDPFGQKVYDHKQYRLRQKLEMDEVDGSYGFDDDRKMGEKMEMNHGMSPTPTPGMTPGTTPGMTPGLTPGLTPGPSPRPDDGRIVLQGIDASQNLLAQLSSDCLLIILNMITGLGNVRTMALYRSLSSELSIFDMERIRDCSVYKCQALFVERYRQNLFDERYKALHQPELIRALSSEPRTLCEFQQDRQRKVLERQYSTSSAGSIGSMNHPMNRCVDGDDDEKAFPV